MKFCYLIALCVIICCKVLLGDVRKNIMAFTENQSHETDFLGNNLISTWTQRARIGHYLNQFEIVRAI